MARAIFVGPYRFTEQDARRTLANAPTIIRLVSGRRDPNPIAHLVDRIDELLEHVDPTSVPAAELPAILAPVWATLAAAPATLRVGGHVPTSSRGSVLRINTSNGGVPKTAVDEVYVDWDGPHGDVQATREHHGRPFQALCLWSAEVIDRLQAAGHPIAYGSAGENVTIRGLDWNEVRPGTRLRIGEVVCEIWAYAVPCRQNAQWMDDGDFGRLHHEREGEFGGAISRVYATVTERGTVRTGDVVVLEP